MQSGVIALVSNLRRDRTNRCACRDVVGKGPALRNKERLGFSRR